MGWGVFYPKATIMAHEEKKNKNTKKVATKAPKGSGPKVPKYEQNETSISPLDLSPKAKKK
ncbi:hypothetical protein GCM10027578_02920 [Spirosoma luteolum]